MSVQIIERDGQPEYAVIPWQDYQALIGAKAPAESTKEVPAMAMLAQLKSLREEQGLTLASVAQQVGVSPAYLEMFERAERVPSAPIRRSLAQVLKVSGFGDPE